MNFSTYTYQLFGLNIASELECPELPSTLYGGIPDMHIIEGMLSESIESPQLIRSHVQIAPGVYQFEIDGVARYRIEKGTKITVYPFSGSSPGEVRLYLLGTAMGALLHQRGLVPLHVCALELDGLAYAFCGESGAGKSTLAATLQRHGLPVLCDDVGVVVAGENGKVMFYSGIPRIKLWQDALDHLGIDKRTLIQDQTRFEKYHLMLNDVFRAEPVPLRRLYQLSRSHERDTPEILPLSRNEAVGLLIENTYRPSMVRRIGNAQKHLQQCARIAADVQTYRYRRPWSLDRIDESIRLLHEHLRTKTV